MLVAGLVFGGLAAALHVYIFWMEALAWDSPRTRKVFGRATPEQLDATRLLAYNQGFYNLFLAVLVGLGIVGVASGWRVVGVTLVLAGAGSMLAAALVLLASDRRRARAAATQGTLPLLSVVLVVAGLLV